MAPEGSNIDSSSESFIHLTTIPEADLPYPALGVLRAYIPVFPRKFLVLCISQQDGGGLLGKSERDASAANSSGGRVCSLGTEKSLLCLLCSHLVSILCLLKLTPGSVRMSGCREAAPSCPSNHSTRQTHTDASAQESLNRPPV